MKVKFSKPNIEKMPTQKVVNILKSGWLTHGKFTNLFEQEFKKFTGCKYAVAVSSCTAGLHLTCLSIGLKKGDEVIVPSQTHTATAHAVEYTGAKVIFSDVEKLTGNISINNLKKKITKKTKAIIVVHMAGYPCDMDEIVKICKKNNILLIEDCAHALGTKVKNKHMGNFGVAGCFSFYPTKQITTGEGGMVITNKKNIFNKIKTLKAFGIDKDINNRKKPGAYDVKFLGFNYRMTDFQACLGYFQLKKYKTYLKKRQIIAKKYHSELSKIKELKIMPYSKQCSYFVFQIFCKNNTMRNKLIKYLKIKKIGFSIHYLTPLHLMSFYKKKYFYKPKSLSNSENYGETNISLPVYPKLDFKNLDYIIQNINLFFKKK